jgi:hypothetical protein
MKLEFMNVELMKSAATVSCARDALLVQLRSSELADDDS